MERKHGSAILVIAAAASLAATFVLTGCEDGITPLAAEDVRLAELPEYTLTILTASNGTSTPSGTFKVKSGEPFALTAVPNSDFVFDFWQISTGAGNATFDDETDATTFVRISGDASIIAVFQDTAVPTGRIGILGKVILDGTEYRSSRMLNLELEYNDNVGVTEMKISETSFGKGEIGGWVPADTASVYAFSSDGLKSVYVRFKDGDGNESNLYSDSVKIDATAPVPSRYEVGLAARPDVFPDYVSVYDDADLRLYYAASDGTGSGVKKVFFSNTTSAPAIAQVDPYPSSPLPFPWAITSDPWGQGTYMVRFWFEDRLGNRSGPFTDTVHFDDRYEGDSGNNSIDAVSGATIILDSFSYAFGQTKNLLTFYSPSWGNAYLADTDFYKWGFYALDPSSTYEAVITLSLNAALASYGDFPPVSFYDHNGDEVAFTVSSYDVGARQITYTLDLPYIDTSGYEYFFHLQVDKPGTSVYSSNPNYNVTWTFNEWEVM